MTFEIWRIVKISRRQKKGGHSKKAYNYMVVFQEKSMMTLQDKKGQSQDASYNYYRFSRMLMITKAEERWRSFSFWVWQGLQQDSEAPAMKDDHGAVLNVDFPEGLEHDSEKCQIQNVNGTAVLLKDTDVLTARQNVRTLMN